MKGVDEHLSQCVAALALLPPTEVALLDALGCVLTQDVVATGPLPPFDASAMDGYAVHSADLAGAGPGRPVTLPVVADLPAGVREVHPLPPGAVARIMTGAPVPPGADAVVQVELTDGGSAEVAISSAPAPGHHVRPAGEGVAAGELLLAAGTRLAPRHLALLAATGRPRVRVRPRPRVAVLSTGSELVEVGDPVGFGQISDANSTALTAAVRAAGAEAHRVGIVDDDPDRLLAVLTGAAASADVLLTSGGVSAGAYDVVKEVLRGLGTVAFDRVAMQPGMPQGLGSVAGVPIFTLPGNPVSAYLSFEVFVRPALRSMMGHAHLHRPTLQAVVGEGWSSPAGKRQYTRAVLTVGGRGGGGGGDGPVVRPVVRPVGGPGSHLVRDLATADVLAVVGEDVTRVERGDVLTCVLLDEEPRG